VGVFYVRTYNEST